MNGIRTTPKIRPTLSLPPVPLPKNLQNQESTTNKANNNNSNDNNTNSNIINTSNDTNSNSKVIIIFAVFTWMM